MLGFMPISSIPLAEDGRNAVVYLEGLEATASVGEVTVFVWNNINPDSGVTYTPITPSSSASFTEITPSAGTSYTEVAPSPVTSYTEITPSSSATWKKVAA